MTDEAQKISPVRAAIAKIMGEVGSIQKRGRNQFHSYDYATAADIAHALQKRMAEAGLLIIPHQVGRELLANETVLACDFEFWVEHVSGDRLDGHPAFTGMASCRNSKGGFDDKAANKCLTAAAKYFVLNLFRIPTGDYQDADQEEDRPAPSPPPQAVATKAKANPFQKSTMDDLDAWFDSNTNADAKSTADATTTAQVAIRAGKLLVDMVENAQDSADDIRERWGHWWTFMEVNSPDIGARFGKAWNDRTGHQEAAE